MAADPLQVGDMPFESDNVWYVRGAPLPSDMLDAIREQGRVHRWGHRAEIALRPTPDEVTAVLSGGVELGERAPLRLASGDVFGELQDGAARALIRAYDDVQLSSLRREAFENIIDGRDVGLVASTGAVRRRQLWVPLRELIYTPPRQRLARVVLRLVDEHGVRDGLQAQLQFALRPRALARLCGLAEREVSDIVDELVQQQIINLSRTRLDVSDLEKVRQLAIE